MLRQKITFLSPLSIVWSVSQPPRVSPAPCQHTYSPYSPESRPIAIAGKATKNEPWSDLFLAKTPTYLFATSLISSGRHLKESYKENVVDEVDRIRVKTLDPEFRNVCCHCFSRLNKKHFTMLSEFVSFCRLWLSNLGSFTFLIFSFFESWKYHIFFLHVY